MGSNKTILIVGAGFAGATVARELANAGHSVRVIDKREHMGGNAYDFTNSHGIRVHKYGPHIFHTSNLEVVAWLSQFTEWMPYKHRVKAMLKDGQLVTLPVNRETASIVGHANIIETFVRPYTEKMWGVNLEELDPDILNRIAVRDDDNELYFPNDQFQAMPKGGYTKLIGNMLDHPGITLQLNQSFTKEMESEFGHVFNSMPIDEYFDFEHGPLPYRSIKFHHVELPIPKIFPVSVVNFTHTEPFTRVTEWKNFPGGADSPYTQLTYEQPCSYLENNLERYYPVKDINGQNKLLFKSYESMVGKNMTFIGRCGLYAYLDMHQAVSTSLAIVRKFIKQTNEIPVS